MATHTILVMADGETWGPMEGASICVISEEVLDALNAGTMRLGDMPIISEIVLKKD